MKIQKEKAERTAKSTLQKHLKEANAELQHGEDAGASRKRAAKPPKSQAKAKAKAKVKKVFGLELPEDPCQRAEVLARAIKEAEELDGIISQIVSCCKLPEKLAITRLEKDAVSRSQRNKAMQELLKAAKQKMDEQAKRKQGRDGHEGEQADECEDDVVYKVQQMVLSSYGWKGAVQYAEQSGEVKPAWL